MDIVSFKAKGRRTRAFLLAIPIAILMWCQPCYAEKPVRVGIATILSGDLSVLGDNAAKSAEAYFSLFPNPRIELVFEDTRLSSAEGLRAYQSLVNREGVDLLIGICTSNATMAAVSLFHSQKVPLISVSTGGSNIDNAGDFVFRIGNSDSLNGIQQAEYFAAAGLKRVAVLMEQTEYTHDITRFFLQRFKELGGDVVFNEEFSPGTVDFRTISARIRRHAPDAIFMPTQTGSALGVFLRQWSQQAGGLLPEIHTTFVAAPNREAHEVAGSLIVGVYYMEPVYSEVNERRVRLFEAYEKLFDHGPTVPFQTAGLADTLDLLSKYLEQHDHFEEQSFRRFLLSVKEYDGMLGTLTFDDKGNTAVGFRVTRITENIAK